MDQKKEKKKFGAGVKASFTTRKFRGGAYATVLSVIAVALVLVVNMIATKLDIQSDLTADSKYSLHDETIELLKGISDDITIYCLEISGEEITQFDKIFSKYDDYNSKIKLAYKDPILYPKFAAQYVDDEITQHSFLVVNESNGRAKYVGYSDIMVREFNYSTYGFDTTGIDLEGKLDAAIQYVTNEELPVIYQPTGHGEAALGASLQALLENANATVNEIQLITQSEIPQDCDILLINQPQTDYTKEETELVLEWLKQGNYAIFILDYQTPGLTNFNTLLQYYGLLVHEGVVIEKDSKHYAFQMPYSILPTVYSSEISDSVRGKKYVLAQWSSGITLLDDMRDTISVTKILYTSEDSYLKQLTAETLEKKEGDLEGPFYVGLTLYETVGEKETKIAVYSARDFLADALVGSESYGNGDLIINTISSFTEQENSSVSVPAMSLSEDMVTMSSADANRIAVFVAVILPLAVIGVGIYVVARRRKK